MQGRFGATVLDRGLVSFAIAILLASFVVSSFVPNAFAATWLSYDDGAPNGYDIPNPGEHRAVRFSLPSGWSAARILTIRYLINQNGTYGIPMNFGAHIYLADGSTSIFSQSVAVAPSWVDVDLTSYNLVVTGDFYVSIETVDLFPGINYDTDSPLGPSFQGTPGNWIGFDQGRNIMIRSEVEQVTLIPVGGATSPINKFEILTPYLALIGLIVTVSTVYVIIKRKD